MNFCMKLMIVLLVLVGGCSILRQAGEDYCDESKLNTNSIRSTSRCILDAWPTRHGLIVGTLGPRIEELPKECIDAMDELDTLSAVDPNNLTDYQLGKTLGLNVRLLMKTVEEILKKYAPEVLRYMP